MIDLKALRANPDEMRENLKKRNISVDLDMFLALDKEILEKNKKLDEIKNQKNIFSKMLPTLKLEEKQTKLFEMKALGEEEKTLTEALKELTPKYNAILYRLPNKLDPTAAIGPDDSGNVVETRFGEPTKFDFEPKPHYEIGEAKGWIDTEKGSEVS